jgi:hypothetical protein
MAWSRDHRSRHNSCDARKPAKQVAWWLVIAQYALAACFSLARTQALFAPLGKNHPDIAAATFLRRCRVFFARTRTFSCGYRRGEAFEIAKAPSVVVNNSIFT